MPELKSLLRVYRFHLWLLLAACLSLFLLKTALQLGVQTEISPDAYSYQQSAANLYLHHIGHNYRPVLMALLTGIPYLFGGNEASVYVFSFWLNLFCWLGSLLVLFEILRQFLPDIKAFWWALLNVFLVGSAALVFELATESVYIFMMLSGFYGLLRYSKTEMYGFLAFGLSALILSMLVKPGSTILAVLLALYFIKPMVFNYASKFTFLIYGSWLLVLMQCAGNKHQFGNFTISYIDAVTAYSYLGAKAESLETGEPFKLVWKRRSDYIYSRPCPEQKQIASADLIRQLQSNTGNFFKAYLSDLWENATTGSIKISKAKNIKQSDLFESYKTLVFKVSIVQNVIFSMAGFLLFLWLFAQAKRYGKAFVPIAFFIGYILLLSGISCSEGDRFNLVVFPFVIVLLARFSARKVPV